jgi:eukaryotic-like serine/threonine-protein kinase
VSAQPGTELTAFTPAYGAPEQWLPKRYGQTGPWTDVWGFALCAVEALTHRAPLEGDAPAIMGACLDERERPTPLALGVKLPDRAEAAFRKALAVDPVQRFQDLGLFWDEIEACSGVSTPRIGGGVAGFPSLPPQELDVEGRRPGPPRAPELTLGLAGLSLLPPRPAAPVRAASAAEGRDEEGPHFSVMRGSSLDQLVPSVGAGSPRRPTAALTTRARRGARSALPSEAPSMSLVLARLEPGLWLIGVGALIMLADAAYTAFTGASFTLGPARALWVAGPLVGLGVVRLVLSLHG